MLFDLRPRGRSTAAPARRRERPSRAQAMVEFALILPVFLFLVVVAIDFGRLFYTNIQIHSAAREGASYGAGAPTDIITIKSRVADEANAQAQNGEGVVAVVATCANQAGGTIDCSIASGGAGAGNTIRVDVRRSFTFLTPLMNGFFGGGLSINAAATATVLGYPATAGATQPPSCAAPTASFSVVVNAGRTVFANPSGSTPNSGVCNISGYTWNWGDTLTSVGTATGDFHTYVADGTYTISLEVSNQAGRASASRTVTVPVPAPTPVPTPVPTATPVPTPVPTPGPTPTPVPTAVPTPVPTPTPLVCTKPVANFTVTTTGNGSNKVYTYRDASTVANPVGCPITDWLWTFTDKGGTQSNAQNPATVQYGNSNSHPVTLKVTNAAGFSTITIAS